MMRGHAPQAGNACLSWSSEQHRWSERFEPALLWAGATDFAGHRDLQRKAGVTWIAVAVELEDANVRPARLCSSPIYAGERFTTGVVRLDDLEELANDPAVRRIKFGRSAIDGALLGTPARDAPAPSIAVKAPMVAVIDHGVAFAHQAFRDEKGGTRIVAFWDQAHDRQASAPWQRVNCFGYGAQLDKGAIDALIAHPGDEMRVYAQAGYAPMQRRVSHGTHVLDLAAGRWDRMRDNDAASRAQLIVVQLPAQPEKDTSGVSLCVHILDALHYISRLAGGRPVVVNLSDGAYAGPHDGSSMLESAIDDFLEHRPNMSFVVAAGNGYETAGHAKQAIDAHKQSRWFEWRVLPDDSTDSFVEVWLGRNLPADADVRLSLQAPDEGEIHEVGLGDSKVARIGTQVVAAVISSRNAPNGLNGRGRRRAMFLIALAPTRPRDVSRGAAPHGIWRFSIVNRSREQIDVDAWIERDDPALGDSGPRRQSYFLDDRERPQLVSKLGTLNSVATGRRSIVVAGCYARGKGFEGRDVLAREAVVRYSSSGPGRGGSGASGGPDVAAPADESPHLGGVLAAGNRSGTWFRMNGTSVAAPAVTRRIVNALAEEGGSLSRDRILAKLLPAGDPAGARRARKLREGVGRVA